MEFNGKIVFLVGCQRSGTTWLQLLVFQHPEIASSQETHMFSRYLRRLDEAWKREQEYLDRRPTGLSTTLTRDEFDCLLRQFAISVIANISEKKPGCAVVVEKTPNHLHDWELISRIFPEACFLHIIRDPRSVVCSLQSAGRSWGSHWSPTTAANATRAWMDAIQEGRLIRSATDRYKEVRYEELLSDGPRLLGEVFEWLGVSADKELCERALAACQIDQLKDGSAQVAAPWDLSGEPKSFYRSGSVEGWRGELSRSDLRIVEYLAGDLMDDLGYVRAVQHVRGKPLRLVRHELSEKIFRLGVSLTVKLAPPILRVLQQDGQVMEFFRRLQSASESRGGENLYQRPDN